jgi:hypothetical protein
MDLLHLIFRDSTLFLPGNSLFLEMFVCFSAKVFAFPDWVPVSQNIPHLPDMPDKR